MYNKHNFKGLIAFFSTILVFGCESSSSDKRPICNESLRVSVFDSSINKGVTDYRLYEITTYPEGIIMKLETVSELYRYKDSLGVICLPLLNKVSAEVVRKFVLVKNGYVFTEYYLKNRVTDTILNAIRLDPDR